MTIALWITFFLTAIMPGEGTANLVVILLGLVWMNTECKQ